MNNNEEVGVLERDSSLHGTDFDQRAKDGFNVKSDALSCHR